MRTLFRVCVALVALGAPASILAAGCGGGGQTSGGTGTTGSGASSSTSTSTASGTGGTTGTGGTMGTGGMTSTGSATGTGGTMGTGGMTGAGGMMGTGGMTTSTSSSTGAGGMVAIDAGMGVIEVVKCLNQIYLCGDGIDNDNDGLIDWQDPDCLGPCDNTEDSYYGGIPGQSGPACDVDCYWDSNSGSGDDDCFWNHKCDPNEVVSPGHPEPTSKCGYNLATNISGSNQTCSQLYQQQSATCLDFCGKITPNGCDCFGCCELPAGGGKWVWLGSEDEITKLGSCTQAGINDPTKCEPCQPVAGCLNTCKHCELCIGKTTLPDDCFPPDGGAPDGGAPDGGGTDDGGTDGGVQMQCPDGVQPCGVPGQPMCPSGFYCITGCCSQHF